MRMNDPSPDLGNRVELAVLDRLQLRWTEYMRAGEPEG